MSLRQSCRYWVVYVWFESSRSPLISRTSGMRFVAFSKLGHDSVCRSAVLFRVQLEQRQCLDQSISGLFSTLWPPCISLHQGQRLGCVFKLEPSLLAVTPLIGPCPQKVNRCFPTVQQRWMLRLVKLTNRLPSAPKGPCVGLAGWVKGDLSLGLKACKTSIRDHLCLYAETKKASH